MSNPDKYRRRIAVAVGTIAVVGPLMWTPPWWVLLPLLLFGVFMLIWGIYPQRVDAVIARYPRVNAIFNYLSESCSSLFASTFGSDRELAQLRRDILWLKENLTDYRPFEAIKDEARTRFQNLQDSDHLIWSDSEVNQLRRDFLNRCGWAIHREKVFASSTEDQEIRREITEIWEQLEHKLSGK